MTTTVQAETDTATRISRRQVLAFIALADAPMPEQVDFHGHGRDSDVLMISFDRVADAQSWLAVLGDAVGDPHEHQNNRTQPQRRFFTAYNRTDDGWHGWKFELSAVEVIGSPDDTLDEATREQLQAIADSSAAHRQVAGSGGAPGQCSAECSCGVVFDGFDTIAEAAALLDSHIEREAELARIAEELGEPIEIVREMADAMAACGDEEQIERKLHAQTLGQPVPVAATCDTCDGKGIIACYGSYPGGPTACIDCHGAGEMPCPDCTPGTGSADPDGGQR